MFRLRVSARHHPSKFNIMSMVMDTLMPILSVNVNLLETETNTGT